MPFKTRDLDVVRCLVIGKWPRRRVGIRSRSRRGVIESPVINMELYVPVRASKNLLGRMYLSALSINERLINPSDDRHINVYRVHASGRRVARPQNSLPVPIRSHREAASGCCLRAGVSGERQGEREDRYAGIVDFPVRNVSGSGVSNAYR